MDSFRDITLKPYRAVVPKCRTAGSIFANRAVVSKFGVAGAKKRSLSSAKSSLSSRRHQKTQKTSSCMRWSMILIVSQVDIELLKAPEDDLNCQQIRN